MVRLTGSSAACNANVLRRARAARSALPAAALFNRAEAAQVEALA
jgi:hypothetical protein